MKLLNYYSIVFENKEKKNLTGSITLLKQSFNTTLMLPKIKTVQDFQKILLRIFMLLFILFMSIISFAQVPWTGANNPYTQNFGAASIATWTNNSTFLGWYAESWKVGTAGTDIFGGTLNITAASPSNSGRWYIYQCNGVADMKLGTRPSNNSGGPDSPGMDGRNGIGLGLHLQNNFTKPISSLQVTFTWYQLSLAENGNNANTNFFSYQTSASPIIDLHTGTWTNVAALNYTAPQNSATAGSAQLNGYPGTQSGGNTGCFDASISIPIGSYIMLRWWDPNNGSNDPHMAIDNVSVTAYEFAGCSVILPITLVSFTGKSLTNTTNLLEWTTSTEINNDYFTLERSSDAQNFSAIGIVNGAGNSNISLNYNFIDETPLQGVNYYRLKQTDFNGEYSYSNIIALTNNNQDYSIWNSTNTLYVKGAKENQLSNLKIYNLIGELIFEKEFEENTIIETSTFSKGIYLVKVQTATTIVTKKVKF